MSDSPEAPDRDADAIVAACRANITVIAESLNQCFDEEWALEVSETASFTEGAEANIPAEAGLVVTIDLSDETVVALVPASLPLPDWLSDPDESQSARLQTLAMEWSLNLLPKDAEAEASQAESVEDLRAAVNERAGEATIIPLNIEGNESSIAILYPCSKSSTPSSDGDDETTEDSETAPVENHDQSAEVEASSSDDPDPDDQAASDPDEQQSEPPKTPEQLAGELRAKRLRKLPVQVIVRLAEKKIDLRQLLALSPGSLIMFNKSCEDLLDLYVNNQRYCRGEAVKIGEKFGLKVDEVGIVEKRQQKVL
ncbi:FliM/FliN family flagellar motor switch protein [Stratiformator vulcanicus]|uniref:Flagellar motor switch protein n=1 Tax=Stratiformator vulcanicus TaxID=2527980 RepID=A0A517QXP4_9PLAN|nr:FliM/FliN family flagellar motor switch protein [Stratiformator vulcanicus]QDT36426.1 flagellar motor switch protein [Stratiformator vulcanicus]